jgi:protein-S-isoprenylcysteine O-methyltransferase Ste14
MLTESVVAVFLLGWLVCFLLVNLFNIVKGQKLKRGVKTYAEVERPADFAMSLATFGTITYFLEVLSYLFLVFTDTISVLHDSPFVFQFPFASYMQIIGLILTSTGYVIFIWSVISRGKYSVSWEMPENQKLVTWGPYHHVRHPSYLGYFLMFLGLFSTWPNLFTLLPLTAIPGYYTLTFDEEKLLMQRFGKEYTEYQNKTGRFIPKLRKPYSRKP